MESINLKYCLSLSGDNADITTAFLFHSKMTLGRDIRGFAFGK